MTRPAPLTPSRLEWTLPLLSCLGLLAVLLSPTGCASHQNRPPILSCPAAVDELVLLAMPIALNLDRKPGVDGFAVKIYALNRGNPKSQPIRSGTLEILMFDGILSSLATNAPRRVWTHPHPDLPRYQFESAVGTGYAFSPRWETNRPARDKITVVARYTSPEARPILSAPSVITVVSQ